MTEGADVTKAYETDVARLKYLNDLRMEKNDSAELKARGEDVDFENPHLVRDHMEQAASALTCATPEEKKAVSDYLAAIQKPDVTAAQLKKATYDLTVNSVFGEHDARRREDNGRLLSNLDKMSIGLLTHEAVVADREKLADLVASPQGADIGRGLPSPPQATPPKL